MLCEAYLGVSPRRELRGARGADGSVRPLDPRPLAAPGSHPQWVFRDRTELRGLGSGEKWVALVQSRTTQLGGTAAKPAHILGPIGHGRPQMVSNGPFPAPIPSK